MTTSKELEVLITTALGEVSANFIYDEENDSVNLGDSVLSVKKLIESDCDGFSNFNRRPHTHTFRRINMETIEIEKIGIDGRYVRLFYKYDSGKCAGSIAKIEELEPASYVAILHRASKC